MLNEIALTVNGSPVVVPNGGSGGVARQVGRKSETGAAAERICALGIA